MMKSVIFLFFCLASALVLAFSSPITPFLKGKVVAVTIPKICKQNPSVFFNGQHLLYGDDRTVHVRFPTPVQGDTSVGAVIEIVVDDKEGRRPSIKFCLSPDSRDTSKPVTYTTTFSSLSCAPDGIVGYGMDVYGDGKVFHYQLSSMIMDVGFSDIEGVSILPRYRSSDNSQHSTQQ